MILQHPKTKKPVNYECNFLIGHLFSGSLHDITQPIYSKSFLHVNCQYLTNFLYCQVSFNPQDNTQLCVVGQGIFKLFRYNEGNLKQFAFQKSDIHRNYLCHAWVSDERIVVGTDNGKILLFESGEIKAEFSVTGLNSPAGGSSSNVAVR